HPTTPPPSLHSFPTRRSSDLRRLPHDVERRVPRETRDVPVRRVALVDNDALVRIAETLDLVEDPFVPTADVEGVVGRVVRETARSEEHTSELQSRFDLVCRLL